MKRIKTSILWILIIGLLLVSSYQTYALASITNQLNKNGITLGKTNASYNFSSSTASLSELPDMAGGC